MRLLRIVLHRGRHDKGWRLLSRFLFLLVAATLLDDEYSCNRYCDNQDDGDDDEFDGCANETHIHKPAAWVEEIPGLGPSYFDALDGDVAR